MFLNEPGVYENYRVDELREELDIARENCNRAMGEYDYILDAFVLAKRRAVISKIKNLFLSIRRFLWN